MLCCFSSSRGRSLRTPGRESFCERLRRRLTPSSPRGSHCSSCRTVRDTPGKVSPGMTTRALPKSRCPSEASLSPNTTGTEARKSAGQVSPRPETPSCSGQVSPEPDTGNLESPSPGGETKATPFGPQETLRSLVYIHPGLAAAIGNNFAESLVEFRPVWSAQAVWPHSLSKPFLPIFLGSQPIYGPFFPGTSTTHTSTRSPLILGRDIMTTSFENYSSLKGLRGKDRDVWCLDNKQLFTTDWAEEEGDPHTASPQLELDEDTWLAKIEKGYELLNPGLPCIPEHPKIPCRGEEESIQPRAAGRWRKLYCANGHAFQAKRFSRRDHCAVCTERVGGLGRLVYKCASCKLSVHKKCHKLATVECGQHSFPSEPTVLVDPSTMASDPPQTAVPQDRSTHEAFEQVDEKNETVNNRKSSKASPALCLQDFNLLRVIGRGSYGKVLLIQLKKSNRMYAMKVVKKELVNPDRVRIEKHILEQVSNCPFLVGLRYCFQTESRLFFVMDYVNGGDLLFHMQQQRIFSEEHARFYSAQISLAFNYLHQRGILYRNLKLDNLMLDLEGHIKLVDYCICKEGLQPGDTTNTFCGTPNYLAPEIIRGEEYGFGVDWWTLGVVMYEMMVGESPFHLVESFSNPYENSIDYLLQEILERDIFVPHCLSLKAASVLYGFLNRDPRERLGSHPQRGFADVKKHSFFRNVNWYMMERKWVVPPFKPNMSGEFGLNNFDPQFTNEPVQFSPVDSDIVRKIDGYEFAGF